MEKETTIICIGDLSFINYVTKVKFVCIIPKQLDEFEKIN